MVVKCVPLSYLCTILFQFPYTWKDEKKKIKKRIIFFFLRKLTPRSSRESFDNPKSSTKKSVFIHSLMNCYQFNRPIGTHNTKIDKFNLYSFLVQEKILLFSFFSLTNNFFFLLKKKNLFTRSLITK